LREPRPLGLKGFTNALRGLLIALGLGIGEGSLELSDLFLELTDHAGGTGAGLRVRAAPFLFFRFAHGGLDSAQATLDAV